MHVHGPFCLALVTRMDVYLHWYMCHSLTHLLLLQLVMHTQLMLGMKISIEYH